METLWNLTVLMIQCLYPTIPNYICPFDDTDIEPQISHTENHVYSFRASAAAHSECTELVAVYTNR